LTGLYILEEYASSVIKQGIWQGLALPFQDKIREILEEGDLSKRERETDVCECCRFMFVA
jgi:hypothetical protein